jgi:CubicO group peptidase (beta-lactamase class C family)
MKLRMGSPNQAGMSEGSVRRIADLAESWVDQGIHPALVVLAARKGIIFLHEAFGRLRPEGDSPPLRRDTVFPLASLTKPITATAAMVLVEDGLLGLNRPVSWYIPEFSGEGKDAVTVQHLLTHTSGLRDDDIWPVVEKEWGSVEIAATDETQHPLIHNMLRLVYTVPLWKPPGTVMSYCTWGYELLGEIVRRVSGQSLADFAAERIFQPLGMKDTAYFVPGFDKRRLVRRAPDTKAAETFATLNLEETPWASAGVGSIAKDMAILGQMLLNRGHYGGARILSSASVAQMTRNQIPGISAQYEGSVFLEASWGLGWSIRSSKNAVAYAETLMSLQAFSHGGAGGTFMWVDPAYDIVGVYFSVASHRGAPPWVDVQEVFGVGELLGRADLFVNAVTAAVVDV